MRSRKNTLRTLGFCGEKEFGCLTAEARPSTGSGRGQPAEPRRARSKEFLIKKYSELCELCGREKKSLFRKNERCKYSISLRPNLHFRWFLNFFS